MKYTDCKKIKQLCDSLFSAPNWREVVSHISTSDYDFEVDGVRFINSADIDRIQQDELSSDLYILGCFNPSFLSGIIGVSVSALEKMQKAEAFEGIGELIISGGYLPEVQAEYALYDGYGHHFNRYDGGEEELRADGETYHVFDNR